MTTPSESLIVYSHLGTSSVRLTEHSAEGTMHLREDLRQRDGLLAAPLGIMLLDCVSKMTRALATCPPTRIDVHVFDPALDVTDLRIRARVLRHGRTQIESEGTIEDASDSMRVVALGTVGMIVTGPPVDSDPGYGGGPTRTADETAHASRLPLTEMFGGRPTAAGGFEIPRLTAQIGNQRLHSGAMQVLAEAAAMNAVTRREGSTRMWTAELATSILTSGRNAPFSIVPAVLAVRDGSAAVRVEVLDAAGGLIAVVSVRLSLLTG